MKDILKHFKYFSQCINEGEGSHSVIGLEVLVKKDKYVHTFCPIWA